VETSLLQFSALAIKQAGVAVKAASFRLTAADLAGIRAQEELSACRLKDMVDALNRRAHFLAERIESITARLLSGALGVAIQQDRPLPIPDLHAARRCYGTLSQSCDDAMEIRRHFHAAQIVRNNARVFPAAISANLLDELKEHALAPIGRIATRASGIPASVILDPAATQTLAAQLTAVQSSRAERIHGFLMRTEIIAALIESTGLVYTKCLPGAGRDRGVKGT
jgi:hypothetical protein